LQHSCGISAKEGELPSMSYQGEAQRLGVARHVFKAPATTLDRRSGFLRTHQVKVKDISLLSTSLVYASNQHHKSRLSEFEK